jgi:hypothetical protein
VFGHEERKMLPEGLHDCVRAGRGGTYFKLDTHSVMYREIRIEIGLNTDVIELSCGLT